MKSKALGFIAITIGLALTTGPISAQQALKTDPAGNPVTALNLGGDHVTGTLSAARLPAGIGVPVVQTIAQTQGSVVLAAGTNVAVLTVPLTGPLTFRLPAANSYPAGRVLVVVDPGGYSSADGPVQVAPGGTDLLNGNGSSTGALSILSGTGAARLYPDGASRWSAGQSHLRAPSNAGLTLAGPAVTGDGTVLSVRDGANHELFFVRGDGSAGALYFDASTAFSSDTETIYSDGDGNLNVGSLSTSITTSALLDLPSLGTSTVVNPDSAARLYYGGDGHLHVRTPDHVDHILTWTTAP